MNGDKEMVEILSSSYVPNPVAKKILESAKKLIEQNPIVARTYEYVSKFSKCGPENAEKAVEELKAAGFSDFAATMLVNLAPSELEETKALLGDIDGGYEDDVVKKGLEILKKYCTSSQEK